MDDIFPKDQDKTNTLLVIFCFAVVFSCFFLASKKAAEAIGGFSLPSKDYKFPTAKDYGAEDVTPRD